MVKFVVKRILMMIPILLGVCLIVFVLTRLTPGDPVLNLLDPNHTQEEYDTKRAELGLDQPLLVQYFNYIKNIVTKFDFGASYQTKRHISTELLERFPYTVKLGVLGLSISLILGIPAGILSAIKQYSPLDYSVTSLAMILAAMPNFWLALMLVILFSLNLKLLPATGVDSWRHWILPALAQGLPPLAIVTRMTRSSMLEVIRQDYITTARAKGIREGYVIRRHALKNALIPIITVIGMQIGIILAGSVVVETIFNIPGLGTMMVSAINARDYPVIQSGVLFIALMVCIVNLVVDILYGFVDPRIMAQYRAGARKSKKKAAKTTKAEG